MLAHILSVFAFFMVSFAIQAANHFVVNTAHYASEPILRAPNEQIIIGGLATMLVQGIALTFLYSRLRPRFTGMLGGLGFSLTMGAFLVSYFALVEPSKYRVNSFLNWFMIEGSVGLIQFALFGLVLGLIHQKWGSS